MLRENAANFWLENSHLHTAGFSLLVVAPKYSSFRLRYKPFPIKLRKCEVQISQTHS